MPKGHQSKFTTMEHLISLKNNSTNKEASGEHALDYAIEVLHVRPEISIDTIFLLTYYAKKDREEKYNLEEMFTRAFKTAHPTWIIRKVKVKVCK